MLPCLVAAVFTGVLSVYASRYDTGLYVQDNDHHVHDGQWRSGRVQGDLTAEGADSHHLPHFPGHHPPTISNNTIFTILSEDPEFSRLFKVVNISDDIVSLLNDSAYNLTFFGVPNHAIPKRGPHRRHPISSRDTLQQDLSLAELISLHELVTDEDERSPDEHFKKLVTAVLAYHIIPHKLDLMALRKNTTYPTRLSHVFGALKDEALRLRFGASLPFAKINYYSDVIKPDIGAVNGFIHVINHPLLPPPSVFQTVFLLQQKFSTFSSAIQRTDLTSALDYKFVPDSYGGLASTEGSPVVTTFAPSNKAFYRLPPKLQLFLFSLYGERALKKLLQFHIVPNVALFTDWVLNTTSDAIVDSIVQPSAFQCGDCLAFTDQQDTTPQSDTNPTGEGCTASTEGAELCGVGHPPEKSRPRHPPHLPFPKPKVEVVANFTLPTALKGHTLNVLVIKVSIKSPDRGKEFWHVKKVLVNGQQASAYDGVALNGALHVVDKLISPRHVEGKVYDKEDVDDWEDWEEWLPTWAEK